MAPLLRTFSALSDETRLTIVEQLMDRGELPVADLVRGSGISAPAISRHLRVLREAGLIAHRADGTRRLYSARPEGIQMIANWTISRRDFWNSGLDRLEAVIAKEDLE